MEHRRKSLSTIRCIFVPTKLTDDIYLAFCARDRSYRKWHICTYMIGGVDYMLYATCFCSCDSSQL
jgi:hypothetical protein